MFPLGPGLATWMEDALRQCGMVTIGVCVPACSGHPPSPELARTGVSGDLFGVEVRICDRLPADKVRLHFIDRSEWKGRR